MGDDNPIIRMVLRLYTLPALCVTRLRGYLFLMLFSWSTFSVTAQPLEGYCIIPSDYKRQPMPESPPIDDPEPLAITVKGKQFRIVVKDNGLLMLDNNNTFLNGKGVGQAFGRVHNVVLGENGWLWIDGDDKDYMAKLDLTQIPPKIGEPVPIPDLKPSPCSAFSKWWSDCDFSKAGGLYSPLLDRVFVTGHRVTLFGSDSLASYEVIAGQAKLLPAQLQGARLMGGTRHRKVGGMGYYYYEDLPHLNGVLFKGQNGDAFFYDGVKVTSLLADYLEQTTMKENFGNWNVQTTSFNKRIFFTYYIYTGVKPFLLELKTTPKIVPISIPDDLSEGLMLYDTPTSLLVFGIMQQAVVIVVEGKLRTIMSVPPPFLIDGTSQQNSDGSIAFTVRNTITHTTADFLLAYNPLLKKCTTTLSTDNPIVFGNELKVNP